ncbi:sugar transporter [Penicillium riverlandense]|uniref:sugar transporter n=1 Tax=Penicillium riverlandense TaxID=1903569 RepID=UPI002549362A|nr:sugar transporter [Penicillium riverlandense]KAJ5825198.1 sugar transporter [Penicillium riverlandense]
MDAFDRDFGVCDAKGVCALEPYYLSLLNGLVYIGFAAGAWIGSFISSLYGRRMTIFCMSIWALVTATILLTSGVSHNKWQLLAGRILNYVYIGMELSSVPVYQSEVVPAPIRGLAVGSYQLSLGIGGLIVNSICRGTSEINDDRSWMIPYGLYYVIPTLVASCIWFIPESPRWLLMKDRDDEALESLITLRGRDNQISPEEELELIRLSLREEADQGTYSDLFKGYNRRRTFIVIGIGFFFQATGNSFSGHYSAVFVKSLGTINPFNVTVAQTAINTVTALVGILLVDRIGRRRIWIVGSFFMLVFMMATGGLGIHTPVSYSASQGIVATMLLYQATYAASVGPLYYTLITEIPASRLRDKTVRLGATANIVTIFIVSFTLPYLQDAPYADLGSKVGFIYGSMSFLAMVFGFICIPELKNRSLEEVERMFETGVSLRNFEDYQEDPTRLQNVAAKLNSLNGPEPTGKGPAERADAV